MSKCSKRRASILSSRPSTALLTAVDSRSHVHLIVGGNALAGARCTKSLEVGAKVIVISQDKELHYSVQRRINEGHATWINREFQEKDLTTFGREEVDNVVDAVFVALPVQHCSQGAYISNLCRRLRVPVNVADAPALCTFTLLATHTDGPLQIGVTTSGRGCKLSSRIKTEIVNALPSNIGNAVEKLGDLRQKIWDEDKVESFEGGDGDSDDSTGQNSKFNKLVKEEDKEDYEAVKTRRIRWLSQICEYWPLKKLCDLAESDVDKIFTDYVSSEKSIENGQLQQQQVLRPGKISLVGSGPGHPELLTTASLKAIQTADLVLADKLVPEAVLDLVPRRASIVIARKFPGNADNAQEELLSQALSGLKQGLNVVRLKQGDPYVYGRGAEEYDFFDKKGYKPIVIPGITSALSAPLFAAIPPTHRSVADQVLVCTGTGRKGAAPDPPAYRKSQTVVFLMALHRLGDLVDSLLVGKEWPKDVSCAVIERASCTDQRVIRSTLEYVCSAVEELGSRPPGLIVVGWACNVLKPANQKWVVEEGFNGL